MVSHKPVSKKTGFQSIIQAIFQMAGMCILDFPTGKDRPKIYPNLVASKSLTEISLAPVEGTEKTAEDEHGHDLSIDRDSPGGKGRPEWGDLEI